MTQFSDEKHLKLKKSRNALIEYVSTAVVTAGLLGYVLIASFVALWIISPGLAAIAFTVGFLIVMAAMAAAPRKKGGRDS